LFSRRGRAMSRLRRAEMQGGNLQKQRGWHVFLEIDQQDVIRRDAEWCVTFPDMSLQQPG
jgi:hypothetical protein